MLHVTLGVRTAASAQRLMLAVRNLELLLSRGTRRTNRDTLMLLLRKPENETIRRFLDEQRESPFSYPFVGATAETPPAGYVVDHTRAELGKGEQLFRAARAGISQWQPFQLGWVTPWPTSTPIERGAVIAIVARGAGLWWLNACRIVYVVDESNTVCRFGFAYGTLAEHAESGEERFVVEWDRSDDRVWYDILAFSRPRHPLARLGNVFVRRLQRLFARDSAAAMRRVAQSLRD